MTLDEIQERLSRFEVEPDYDAHDFLEVLNMLEDLTREVQTLKAEVEKHQGRLARIADSKWNA